MKNNYFLFSGHNLLRMDLQKENDELKAKIAKLEEEVSDNGF